MRAPILAVALLMVTGIGCRAAGALGLGKAPENKQEINIFMCPMHPGVQATWAGKCPMCGMSMTRPGEMPMGSMMEMHGRGGEPMQPMHETHGMMMRMRMMMQAEMRNGDPSALMALREELQLTDKQVADLKALADDAEKKAMALLTDKQNEELKSLPPGPRSMMDMHRMMRGGMMGGGGMGGEMMHREGAPGEQK